MNPAHIEQGSLFTHGNRLRYVTYSPGGPYGRRDEWMYKYDLNGNLWLAVRAEANNPNRRAVRFINDPHGRPWLALYYGWEDDGDQITPNDTWNLDAVREFRYDSGRQRYLVRERCPDQNGCEGGAVGYMEPLAETWTDYDGDEYGSSPESAPLGR